MLGIVVAEPDEASVAIGEQLRVIHDWERTQDEDRPAANGGGTVWQTEGAELRTFADRHLDLVRPADAFTDPSLLAFASKHAGDTGRVLTAHHTGNFGPADHGGEDNALARACPNAHAHVLDALARYAPEGYDVGMECTHHGPTDVGAPSMFVEVGSGREQWADAEAASAVARAILDLRGVAPDGEAEDSRDATDTTDGSDTTDETNATRRHLVGFGGGHYAPRFERVARETDWAVGHVAADWGLDAMPDPETPAGKALLDTAFAESAAAYALVAEDREDLAAVLTDLGFCVVGETWVRETDGVPLDLVHCLEAAICTVGAGLRFGDRADTADEADLAVASLPRDLLETARGIDLDATREAIRAETVAYSTDQGGSRPTETVALARPADRKTVVDRLAGVLGTKYDEVEREGDTIVARETAFAPEKAATLGIPEGPKFGALARGETVEVDGRTIEPETVSETRTDRFTCR